MKLERHSSDTVAKYLAPSQRLSLRYAVSWWCSQHTFIVFVPQIHAKHVKALDIESEEVDVGETAAALTAILSSKEDLKSLMELKGPDVHDVQSFIDLLDRVCISH